MIHSNRFQKKNQTRQPPPEVDPTQVQSGHINTLHRAMPGHTTRKKKSKDAQRRQKKNEEQSKESAEAEQLLSAAAGASVGGRSSRSTQPKALAQLRATFPSDAHHEEGEDPKVCSRTQQFIGLAIPQQQQDHTPERPPVKPLFVGGVLLQHKDCRRGLSPTRDNVHQHLLTNNPGGAQKVGGGQSFNMLGVAEEEGMLLTRSTKRSQATATSSPSKRGARGRKRAASSAASPSQVDHILLSLLH
jgi:hypothetical protein